MTSSDSPIFSIIVPTRGRPDGLGRLLDSFKSTTSCPDTLEIITVIDQDDRQTLEFEYEGLLLKRVVVQPGLNMGALNMAGYAAAAGKYIMLLNDDVIVRTPGWDGKVLAAFRMYGDEIVLVHVNDKIFEEKLCTFPFLSRTYCELAGGICPPDYVRYRIDDHIYSVFNLLAFLGKIRILYLPDIVFEHTNFVVNAGNGVEYRPDERIHQIDTKRFHELLPERKALAMRLMDHIGSRATSELPRVRERLLNQVVDSVSLRRPEYVKLWWENKLLSTENTRVTIGVVSANLNSDHARTCIDLIKKFTSNFDLVILDNNHKSTFNHPHEMNRLLSICDTDFLVLMDDDVFVEAGWLDGMLRCVTPSVGVVTPLHKDRNGNLSYAGVVMRPDYSGHHTHIFNPPERSSRVQTLCSASLLIDVTKCGHIRFDESYSKYFLDIDYGFRVWQAGFEVVCSPYSMVTHIGGGTLQYGTRQSEDLVEADRRHYVSEWIRTGRYRELETGIWQNVPEIKKLLDVPGVLSALLEEGAKQDSSKLRNRVLALFRFLKDYPTLRDWAREKVWEIAGDGCPPIDDCLGFFLGCTPRPVLVEPNYNGLKIVLYDADYYAIPATEGVFRHELVVGGSYAQSYQAENLDILKARVRLHAPGVMSVRAWSDRPVLVEENVCGLNIISFKGDFYAIPQGEGSFDHDRFLKGDYSRSYRAASLDELARICANGSVRFWRMLKIERKRFGSWTLAIRSTTKAVIKKWIISVFGVLAFHRLKDVYSGLMGKEP